MSILPGRDKSPWESPDTPNTGMDRLFMKNLMAEADRIHPEQWGSSKEEWIRMQLLNLKHGIPTGRGGSVSGRW